MAQLAPGEALSNGTGHGAIAGRKPIAGGCKTAAMRDAVSAAVCKPLPPCRGPILPPPPPFPGATPTCPTTLTALLHLAKESAWLYCSACMALEAALCQALLPDLLCLAETKPKMPLAGHHLSKKQVKQPYHVSLTNGGTAIHANICIAQFVIQADRNLSASMSEDMFFM